jgi:general secretion pathway protein F
MNDGLLIDQPSGFGWTALIFVLYVLFGVLPACGVLYVVYYLLTLPLRRNERARLFLDLLESGLKEGRTPEMVIAGLGASHVRAMGDPEDLFFISANLRRGIPLSNSLDQLPHLLPVRVRAMIRSGERIGDLTKVLPACRQSLEDGPSRVRGAANYVFLLGGAITPVAIFITLSLRIMVLPKFVEVFYGLGEGIALPAFTRMVLGGRNFMTAIQVALLGFIWAAAAIYVFNPRWRILAGLSDWLAWHLPWRRKRFQRDFSAMLAVLLDSEMPEAEAVRLAGESTGNRVFARRAAKVCARLREGVKLTEAISALDDSGELRWRIANALRHGGGFARALGGWHEALDAKAFQLEQSAAHLATTGLVLLNGLIVASVIIAIFLVIVQLTNNAALW